VQNKIHKNSTVDKNQRKQRRSREYHDPPHSNQTLGKNNVLPIPASSLVFGKQESILCNELFFVKKSHSFTVPASSIIALNEYCSNTANDLNKISQLT
jgi:hypothetical protein